MDYPPSRRSDDSLISLEMDFGKSFVTQKTNEEGPGKSRREDAGGDGNMAQQPTMGTQHDAVRSKKTIGRSQRGRQNSLRHVKNSTDLLRQRSLREKNLEVASDSAGGREGRQFTVGNVGTNGLIYLRPVVNPAHARPQPPPFVLPPITPPNSASLHESSPKEGGGSGNDTRRSVWSNSQLSDITSKPVRRVNHSTPSETTHSGHSHNRAHSFSTIDDSRTSSGLKPGVFRVVIDRSESVKRPKTAEQLAIPTLEVPIPHYRLGTPRFSDQGTPALRSSAYTRTSVSDNFRVSALAKGENGRFPPPPSMGSSRFPSRNLDPIHSSLQPNMSRSTEMSHVTRSSAALPSPVFYKFQDTIEPDIYDTLASNINDPSVVRYSSKTGQISAASPARIVAEISSDSFMDYELVSDFFLTFRSYLSTQSLLGLLLARLHWAINRLEEDGRIIRIRTFAALRHWILNYFVDDFVVNRELRVLFCDKINSMYHEVKNRTQNNSSDTKILLDLKRCWNGRCSLYWDAPEFQDVHRDADIIPGGVVGSRESHLSRLYVDDRQRQSADPQAERGPIPEGYQTPIQAWFGSIPQPQLQAHLRHASEVSMEMPVSPTSDQSIQAVSCSFPPIGFRRTPSPSGPARAPHPVLLTTVSGASSPPTASLAPAPSQASWRRPAHAHKRSGSFSDAARDDRAPLPSPKRDRNSHKLVMAFPYTESLIRGDVYPPTVPYIDVLLPIPPPGHPAQSAASPIESTNPGDGLRMHNIGGNGYRSLFGSIRRALSSRQSDSHRSLHAVSGPPSVPSVRGKTSTLPLNVTYQADAPRERRMGHGNRAQTRIDMLCAEVLHAYKSVGQKQGAEVEQNGENIGVALGDERNQPSPAFVAEAGNVGEKERRRLPSQMTAGSKSIVIVDDTGFDIPLMTGALSANPGDKDPVKKTQAAEAAHSATPKLDEQSHLAEWRSKTTVPSHLGGRSSSLERGLTEIDREARLQGHLRTLSQEGSLQLGRSSSVDRRKRVISEGSSLLRRYASYQSGISKHGLNKPGVDAEATASGSAEETFGDLFDKPPARLLRRRPGGDLRKIQNVHDLEPEGRPQSAGSATTYTDSIGGSVLYMAKNRSIGAPPPFSPPAPEIQRPKSPAFSLIRTHSSQHMRPSFEAAVAGFSQIPDDPDGGVEATLLKLEGTYKKPAEPPQPQVETEPQLDSSFLDKVHLMGSGYEGDDTNEKRKHRHKKVAQDGISQTPEPFQDCAEGATPTSDQQVTTASSAGPRHVSRIFGLPTESVAGSEDSYSSVPLLERGISDQIIRSKKPSPERSDVSVPPPLFSQNASGSRSKAESSHPSIEVVEETESMKRMPQGSTQPQTSPVADSFLLDEGEHLTDISSEISVEFVDASDSVDSPPGHDSSNQARRPLVDINPPLDAQRNPPSPPTTMDNPIAVSSHVNPMAFQNRPLTPEPSPTSKMGPFAPTRISEDPRDHTRSPQTDGSRPGAATPVPSPGHLPFILACDSETLAQQFIVVERAALSEIDWKDLVDMRWATRQAGFHNWVQYLCGQDHRGVDLVTARFNIVVKWALSEIVMTKDINERARTIMKCIHVASRSRKLRNYATMLQLTIALTSIDCTRLEKTWELVPPAEKQMLKEMEGLIQPVKNFHDLRIEMETADLQNGCIPFVGLYVHDLTYNAQKPAQIASTRNDDPLVNFERYRTAATIVKSLLRLIDSSSKYTYLPIEGVVERCLWMAALSDEKIQAMSQGLE